MAGLVLQEIYKYIGFSDLSFDLSFDKVIIEESCHWLGLQTFARGVPISVADLPVGDIVITAFNKGSPELLFAIPFVAQLLLAGSYSALFQPSDPWVRDILFLLAKLHDNSLVGLRCVLEIEILFSNLSLHLSDFWSHPFAEHSACSVCH